MSTGKSKGRSQRRVVLVAFGGNALLRPDDMGTDREQRKRAEEASRWLVRLIQKGNDLVIVHGNGPQVGQVLIQMEEAATKVPPGSLDVAVAQTQGSMGFLLEVALRNRLTRRNASREVVTVLSQVVVDGKDPGFTRPSKPIGPFFSRYRAEALRRELGWQMKEDEGRGWRKVVASPRPLEILGVEALRRLVEEGYLLIAAGGGGIPVVRQEDGSLRGVEAVIDKDRTAVLLARAVGAELVVNLTGVVQVSKNFGKRSERPLSRLTVRQARKLLEEGHFPAGSMGPKIESAAEFVETTGGEVVITDIAHVEEAVAGKAGTRIAPR